jgi:Domain of unknown function (DUF4157)
MENAFSSDFAAVRVHTGAAAHEAAAALDARALTAGTDILFRADEYQPGTPGGDRLLAHELAHVIQQAHGLPHGIPDTDATGRLENAAELAADRANSFTEREAHGKSAERGAHGKALIAAAGPSPAGLVQRQPDPNAPTSQPTSSHCCGPVGTCPLPGTLTLPRFATSAKLENVREDKDRLGQGDPDVDAASRIQQAFVDVTQVTGKTYDLGATGPKKNGVDGIYGAKTAAAVSKFKGDEGLGCEQFGDVGPGTMKRLNELLNQPPPPPPTQPTLNPPDCKNKVGDTLPVTGTGFPPGATVLLSVDGIPGNAALADAQTGAIASSISASGLKSGGHVVEGTSGGAHATAQFTCGAGPQPGPAPVPKTGTHRSTAEGDKVQESNTVTGTEKVPADSSSSVEFSVETGITAIHYSRVPAPSPGGNCDTGHFQLNLNKKFTGHRITDRLHLLPEGQLAIDIFPVTCRQDPSLQLQLALLKTTIIPDLLELNLNSLLGLQGPPRAWSLELEPDLALSLKPWLKIPGTLHLKLDLGTVYSQDPHTPNTNVTSGTVTYELPF